MAFGLSIAVLAVVLGFAAVRPRGLPEAAGAVPAALLVVVVGLVSWPAAGREVADLAPVVAFLVAVLVLAHLADVDGVFGYAGAVAGRWSRGEPRRLLTAVFVAAAAVTATLSLDATVVLLTPVVLATATAVSVRPAPHLYACGHLANSASLLLPVSNLTNLLAYAASGLSLPRFAALMAGPWLMVIGVEYLVFRWFFAGDLATPAHPPAVVAPRAPRFALVVLAGTLAGFGVAQPLGVHPAWVAAAGAAALAARRMRPPQGPARGPAWPAARRRVAAELADLWRAANPGFAAFVFGLGVVVLAVRDHGAGAAIARLVPAGPGLPALLATAGLAAVLANLLNNLPATLLLVPLVRHDPGLVLAVLLGVDVGPNLTYVGSLATLLWRQVLHRHEHPPGAGRFLLLGLATVPACLLAGVAALWLGLRWWGP